MAIRIVLVLAIFVLVGCQAIPTRATPTPAPTSSVQPGGTFRVALSSEPMTLDPWNASEPSSLLVTRQIFETLVEYAPGGFGIVPKLAESWQVSGEGRVWTFTLRRGVKFHDGTDLDAAAVVLNLERARLTAHPLRGTGADRFASYAALLEGFDDASVIAKVEARDARTVVITTKVAFGPLLADLALPTFGIVSPKSMRDDPAGWSTPASTGAAGTGPFSFRPSSWLPGQIALERSGTYWLRDQNGAGPPYVDRIVLRVIKDEAARIAELRSGGLDAVRDLTPAVLPTVKADPNLDVLTRPALNVAYLGVSDAARPLDKVEVRRAIAMAIDRSVMTTALYSGAGRSASQLIPPGLLGYDESVVEFTRHDVAGAKRLLTEAGVGSGFATELWYPTAWRSQHAEPRRLAESVAADLARIGITVALRPAEPADYRADIRADRLPLWIAESAGESADPDSFFADGGAWAGDVVRELLRRARYEADPSKRTELYKQVSKLIQQDAARIPLVHADSFIAATKKVRGLVPHPIGVDTFAPVWLGK